MLYIYFDKKQKEFHVATNIKSLSEAVDVSYYKLYRMFNNGSDIKDTDEMLLGKADSLLKGNQRMKGTPGIVKLLNESKNTGENAVEKNDFDDFFKKIDHATE